MPRRRAPAGSDVLEQLTGDHGVESLALQRQRLLDVGRDDVDAELLRFRQRRLVHVDADDVVPSEEVASESAGAAARSSTCLPSRSPPGREGCARGRKRNRPRFGARGGESRTASRGTWPYAGLTAASCPREVMVFLKPSSSSTSGCQPSSCFARVMSGCGPADRPPEGPRTRSPRRAREPDDGLRELEQRLLVQVAEVRYREMLAGIRQEDQAADHVVRNRSCASGSRRRTRSGLSRKRLIKTSGSRARRSASDRRC